MHELRRRLLARAFLYDHPASYRAGVEAALHEVKRAGTTHTGSRMDTDRSAGVLRLPEFPESG